MPLSSSNPIIPGFAPDPSVCLIGETYFLVNSSFHVFPGLPIYASRDLISWSHIGNAINRPSQLSLQKATTFLDSSEDDQIMVATGGLYAPTIRHHAGITYIVCTNIIHESTTRTSGEATKNFIIYTSDIWSDNWSKPIYYDFDGIDPSILFDDDGRVYIQGSKTPEFQIFNMEVNPITGEVLTSPSLIWNGWDQRWTEGPHIYKKDGWYYLLVAEGGTFTHHMISMARSKSVWGPYEACPNNPILTAYGTERYIQHTGHAELFQDTSGGWWAAMLGVRKIQGRFVLGRETFITPAIWNKDEWPTLEPVKEITRDLPESADAPFIEAKDEASWAYLRDPRLDFYTIEKDTILLRASKISLSNPISSPSFLGKRQRLLEGTSSAVLHIPSISNDTDIRIGMAVYKDEHRFAEISWHASSKSIEVQMVNEVRKFILQKSHFCETQQTLHFLISYTEMEYGFSFAHNAFGPWKRLATVDTIEFTNYDFTGPLIGLFAVGDDIEVHFEAFRVD